MRKHSLQALLLSLSFLTLVALTSCRKPSATAQAATTTTTAASSADASNATADEAATADDASTSTSSTLPGGIEIPVYESPRGGQVIHHTGFTLSYDADFKTPQWVAWTLTAAKAEGTVPREKNFRPDPDVRGAQAYTKDYSHSGYDRGHIAPAGDMKWSEDAMRESFYLTNVCPQNQNLNRGDWKDLEELERTWALRYGAVSIAAGPVYSSKTPQRIGANKVAVPDAFFKVLLIGYPDNPRAYAFVFPNEAGSHALTYYQFTVDDVEDLTGMDFFSALPDDVEAKIEAEQPALP